MEIGRYLVLSTVHLHVKTAELLTLWASFVPSERPLAIASTQYGWFVPTRETEGDEIEQIPADLIDAMRLGREQGCDYLLFDCDGPAIEDLSEFPW